MLKCNCLYTEYRGTSLWYNIIITFNIMHIIAYYVRIIDNV